MTVILNKNESLMYLLLNSVLLLPGTITPTDDDSGTNAFVTCSWASNSIYSTYYALGANCNIYLTKEIDFASSTQVTYVLPVLSSQSHYN